ncbi:hypothetical protein [Streptomyces bacillaris]|uniref:hypothetical protein n=1 Tax=Streptomyces bacillaris TaxID=68179 RepID=UPI003628F851
MTHNTTPAPETSLPPFTGDSPLCQKCGHDHAYTEYRAAGAYGGDEPPRWGPSPKGERLERRCGRCSFTWDEALAPHTGPTPYDVTLEDLALALRTANDGCTPGFSPECAAHAARGLLSLLTIRWRHDVLAATPLDLLLGKAAAPTDEADL